MKKIPYLAPLAQIIPLEYDQSISYYEFLNKLYQYVDTELLEKVEEIIEMVNPLLQEFPELKEDVNNLKQFALQTNDRLSEITHGMSTMRTDIGTIQSHITEIDGSISALNASIQYLNNTVSNHSSSIQFMQGEITGIQETIITIQTAIRQINERLIQYPTIENTVNEINNGFEYIAEFESVTQDTNVYIDFSNICNYSFLKNHELFIIINQPIGSQDGNAIHTLTIGNTTINLAKFNQLTISNKNIVLKLTLIDDSPEMYIINELEYNTSYTQNYNGANLITRPSDLTTDFAFRYNLVGFTGTATAKVYSKVL